MRPGTEARRALPPLRELQQNRQEQPRDSRPLLQSERKLGAQPSSCTGQMRDKYLNLTEELPSDIDGERHDAEGRRLSPRRFTFDEERVENICSVGKAVHSAHFFAAEDVVRRNLSYEIERDSEVLRLQGELREASRRREDLLEAIQQTEQQYNALKEQLMSQLDSHPTLLALFIKFA